MAEPYDLFFQLRASVALKRIREARRKALLNFFDNIEQDPFLEGSIQFLDLKERSLNQVTIADYAVTLQIDHAVKEVKIMEIEKL